MSTNAPGAPVPLHLQIRAARLNAKLTVSQLAQLAGVNRTWLQKFENNGKNITVESLGRIIAQLPNAHFVVPGGASLGSAATGTAEMAAHMRELVRLTGVHAARIDDAAEAVAAMAESAASIARHINAMQQLWEKSAAGTEAGDWTADRPDELPIPPLPSPAAPVEEPLIRKRTLRFSGALSRLFRSKVEEEE